MNRHRGRGAWHQLVISGNGNRWHPAGVNLWLRELGIFGQRSHEKRLPAEVFALANDQVVVLLQHLWATDGTISPRRPGARGSAGVNFSTSSRGLRGGRGGPLAARGRRGTHSHGPPAGRAALPRGGGERSRSAALLPPGGGRIRAARGPRESPRDGAGRRRAQSQRRHPAAGGLRGGPGVHEAARGHAASHGLDARNLLTVAPRISSSRPHDRQWPTTRLSRRREPAHPRRERPLLGPGHWHRAGGRGRRLRPDGAWAEFVAGGTVSSATTRARSSRMRTS